MMNDFHVYNFIYSRTSRGPRNEGVNVGEQYQSTQKIIGKYLHPFLPFVSDLDSYSSQFSNVYARQ